MARLLRFTKMQGLGNDFVVLDGVEQPIALPRSEIRRLADRHFGVGCDQVLLVEKPTRPDADFRYRIFNADGEEVEQCGNGARCLVHFVRARGLTDKRALRVETAGGVIEPALSNGGEVTVGMGVPSFRAADLPFLGGTGQPASRSRSMARRSRFRRFRSAIRTRFRLLPTWPPLRLRCRDRKSRPCAFPQTGQRGLYAGRRSRQIRLRVLGARRGRDVAAAERGHAPQWWQAFAVACSIRWCAWPRAAAH